MLQEELLKSYQQMSGKPLPPKIDCFDGTFFFLSNFFPTLMVYEGLRYPSSEHAYQASKSTNEEERLLISKADTPNAARRMGRQVSLRDGFDNKRLQIMEDILRIKFENPVLRLMLKATGEVPLIEGNFWNDTYWGICKGKGENNLGRLLMKLRRSIQNDHS